MQELVAANGGAITITPVAITSLGPSLAPPPLGSKLVVNKKQAMHHAKGNSSNNSKVAMDATIKSLRAQVQQLEKQCQFLTSWRLEPLLGVNAKAAFIDVELKASDGLFVEIQAPLIVVIASYGCCCSCCSCSLRVEKEEVTTTQKHKKPARKKNPKKLKTRKNLSLLTLSDRE
jgi:hypothetical protein